MSTEDIKFRLTTDEAGAVAGFKRLRSEVLNNEHGLKQIAKEGKTSGRALKDMANVLGPEFQMLGDRFDHVTGALEDINGAGIVAKASLVTLVAVGSFEVGRMIGDWVFQTEQWKQALADAVTEAGRLNTQLGRQNAAIASGLTSNELQQEIDGTSSSIQLLRKQIEAIDQSWWGSLSAENLTRDSKQAELNALREQLATFKAELATRQESSDLTYEDRMAALANLLKPQTEYLEMLDLELIKLREGDEAYERSRLTRLGWAEANINEAIELQKQIKELTKAQQQEANGGTVTFRRPAEVRGDQQRFITRGVGMKGEEKMLAAAKEQAKKAAELVAESKKQTRLLETRLPKEVIA